MSERVIEAIELLEKGNWQAAHAIVQEHSSALASWAHGIVHLMEGDASNAGYWYRRAGRDLPGGNATGEEAISEEIAALKAAVGAGQSGQQP